MGLRTIEAPGVEVKEIDKSAYTPAMTGSKCYVMGYANKGTPYEPMQFTSKASWQLYYGDPRNEAERYFYNACAEVINQNGVLNCARLPYDNASRNKMVGFKYKVGTTKKTIPSAGDYLKGPIGDWTDHDKDFETDALMYTFGNKFYREIDGKPEDGFEFDDELKMFYNKAIEINNEIVQLKYSELDFDKTLATSADCESEAKAREYLKTISVEDGYEKVTTPSICIKEYHGGFRAMAAIYKKTSEFFPTEAEADKRKDELNGTTDIDDVFSFDTYYKISIQYVEDPTKIRYSINYYSLNLEESLSLSARFLKYKQAEEYARQFTDSDVSGLYVYDTNLDNIIIRQGGDWLVQPLKYDFQKITHIGDEEIKDKSVAEAKLTELLSEKEQVPVTNVVNNVIKIEYIERVKNVKGSIITDGYDDEYLFDTTVSAIYNDLKLSSETYFDGIQMRPMTELWDELYEEAKGKSLKQLAKQTADPGSNDYIKTWKQMIDVFKNEGNIKFTDIVAKYGIVQERISKECKYYAIADGNQKSTTYLQIEGTQAPYTLELKDVDAYRSGEQTVPAQSFIVVDKTCSSLKSIPEDSRKGKDTQLIGIFPVITTAANALYAQSMIDVVDADVTDYETVINTVTKDLEREFDITYDISKQFSNASRAKDDAIMETVSRTANEFFLPIQMKSDLKGFESENMKKIGVVVFKAYLDASEGNKVSFEPVESFVGSLDKNDKNPNTGVSTFIDKIVNTQSDYIYFFSNCFINNTSKKTLEEVDTFIMKPGKSGMLGFYTDETSDTISLSSLYQGIDDCLEKVSDINERDIDIIPDAGLANIAQYLKSIYGSQGAYKYDINAVDEGGNPLIKMWTCNKQSDTNAWKTVEQKLDNFCKNVRKDCMFIADGPRPLVIQGNVKIVRPTKPDNTIDANILPYIKWATGLNTNYGAGYLDWFQITDEFTGDEFWCPPSIKAMGVYINTDLNFNYWDAPAGLNRGMVQALDVAFSPTVKQAGQVYNKNWNYAINYPNDGIVLEGQKTFQVKPSAFDRVNVRRLFLRLERQTYKVARYFVYEGNTAYTRQRLIDMLNPLFYTAKVGGGIYDYKIICDESINTPTVIDNNELRVKIGIKPVKAAEFILIDFIALSTGGSFSEM